MSSCRDCLSFTDKKTSEPLAAHAVPENNWSKVAVDLFGPLPSQDHIVVIQDMASRFPAAKLVKSTRAANVIPAMKDIYDNYGNPETQLSDNGPPFNSAAMDAFCKSRNIEMEKIPPLHPSANPAETFMRSIGKTMKISHQNNMNKQESLSQLLANYRDTPHPSTGATPNEMFFRHPPQSVFPRKSVHDSFVEDARYRDASIKHTRQQQINSSKYRKLSQFQEGDIVLMRNFNKRSKYDPYFQYDPLTVTQIDNSGRCITVMRLSDGRMYKRHPDDIKLYRAPVAHPGPTSEHPQCIGMEERHANDLQQQLMAEYTHNEDYDDEPYIQAPMHHNVPGDLQPLPQRPVRQRIANPRYFNDQMVN